MNSVYNLIIRDKILQNVRKCELRVTDMERLIYLLNVSVFGIKSIEKEVKIRFYKNGVDRNFDPEKYRIKAIYGENGSGKSGLITAIKIFKRLIMDEDYLSDPSNQKILNEIINKKTRCFRFECEYLRIDGENNVVYKYGFELQQNERGKYEIAKEYLRSRSGNYPSSVYRDVFKSENGELIFVSCDDNCKNLVAQQSFNMLSTRSLVAILLTNSKAYEDKYDGSGFILSIVLCAVLALITKVYLSDGDRHELYFIQKTLTERVAKNELSNDDYTNLYNCLNGYTSVTETKVEIARYEKYKENVVRLSEFIRLFKRNLKSIDIDAKENGDFYDCELIMDYGEYRIAQEFESTGIKKLIELYDSLVTASNGGIVFIDEMDSNINDVYLCRMIEYLMYYGKGQLCFTTHNIDPMSILKENKNSIDFLSSDNVLVPWKSKGNAIPESYYKNGMIQNLPFNVYPTDFIGILGE